MTIAVDPIARKRVANSKLAVENLNSQFELRQCKRCGADVHWMRTLNGKWMAVNATKRIGANWLVKNHHFVWAPGEGVFDCHFDTCPGEQ